MTSAIDILRELAAAELERLQRDHYGDGRSSECAQCQRAAALRTWLKEHKRERTR